MTQYRVMEDYHSAEFEFDLYEGDEFSDGDSLDNILIEPDLIANLLTSGVLVDVKAGKKPKKAKEVAAMDLQEPPFPPEE